MGTKHHKADAAMAAAAAAAGQLMIGFGTDVKCGAASSHLVCFSMKSFSSFQCLKWLFFLTLFYEWINGGMLVMFADWVGAFRKAGKQDVVAG